MQRSGEKAREAAELADYQLRRAHAPAKAAATVAQARLDSEEPRTQAQKQKRVAEVSAEIVTLVWSAGGYEMAEAVWESVTDRQSIRTLCHHFSALESESTSFISKDNKVKADILLNVRCFIEKLSSLGATASDRAAAHACISCLVKSTADTNDERTGRAYQRVLNITHRFFKKCQAARDVFLDGDNDHWVKLARGAYKNRLSEEWLANICAWLHSDDISYPDNDFKTTVKIKHGIDDSGRVLYEEHERRVISCSKAELLEKLTGFKVVRGRLTDIRLKTPPHKLWTEITKAYPKIIGSYRLLKRAWCKCFRRATASICVCTLCHQLRDMIRIYLACHRGWHTMYRAENDGHDCDCSDGLCHPAHFNVGTGRTDAETPYRHLLRSADGLVSGSMCPPVERPSLGMPDYDPITSQPTGTTTPFCIPPRPCFENECTDCGVNRIMHNMGLPVCGRTDGSICINVCKVDGDDTKFVVWNEFRTVVRTSSSTDADDDADYASTTSGGGTTTEFVPRRGTRLEFMSQLYTLANRVKPHRYQLKIIGRAHAFNNVTYVKDVALGKAERWAEHTALMSTDFAAVTSHDRSADSTCATKETHNTAVFVIRKDPRLVAAADVDDKYRHLMPCVKRAVMARKELDARIVKVKDELCALQTELEQLNVTFKAALKSSFDAVAVLRLLESGEIMQTLAVDMRDPEIAQAIDILEKVMPPVARPVVRAACRLVMRIADVRGVVADLEVESDELKDRASNASGITTSNLCAFVYTKEKGSAAVHNTALRTLVHLLNNHQAPDGFKGEIFVDGERVHGSCTDGPDLPPGLKDSESGIHLGDAVKRVVLSHDGCAAQYEGLRNYLGIQRFPVNTSLMGCECDLVDIREVSQHGKGPHDGFGSQPANAVRKATMKAQSAADGAATDGAQSYDTGLQAFVRAAAVHLKAPAVAALAADRGFNQDALAMNVYIHIYLPPSAVDHASVNAVKGYAGSSADHFRRPLFGDREKNLENTALITRELPCACPCCRKASATASSLHAFSRCAMVSEIGLPRHHELKSKGLDATAAEVATLRLDEFCKDYLTKVNARVLVRSADGNEDEPYYIGLVKSAHRKLTESATFSGQTFSKGAYVVEVTWCGLRETRSNGTRRYAKLQWLATIGVNQISRSGTKILAAEDVLTFNRKDHLYELTQTNHERLLNYGDITAV